MRGVFPAKGLWMRAPSERDQCQAMLDILVEGFMRDDVPAYREACARLRDFAHQKNIERGRVMRGSNWYNAARVRGTAGAQSHARAGRVATPAQKRRMT